MHRPTQMDKYRSKILDIFRSLFVGPSMVMKKSLRYGGCMIE
jgi:hypothetical protein